MFKDIYHTIPLSLQIEIKAYAKANGAKKAAREYYQRVGMKELSLYQRLNKTRRKEEGRVSKIGRPIVNKKSVEKKLDKDEKKFLVNLKEGKVGLEEAGRIVASRVFERMLRNPDDFKYIDFFRTELLRIKESEGKQKEKYQETILSRLFAGKLPPQVCPSCGYRLIDKEEILEGEVLDETIPTTINS